ncbi:glycosyltransferase family 2 protein [Flavobacterium ardleyense]|uniref:glycosyltransferase family 2 protein n=1 Tax=Flavobacterium ardleyense TaxID=2038737 RepID=UPI00298D0719|nr:glycosyltransferase family A protein [Flavobacterium ardleyense]
MSNNPTVSVVVPCYNQAQYLDEALQSVLDQTYTDWECIIVNDGSPDNTAEVAQKWVEKDFRFKYIHQENAGLSAARNAGIELAQGEFILPLDSDDKIGKDYLRFSVEVFQKDAEIKVVYCKARKFGSVDMDWDLPPFDIDELFVDNMIFCSAFFKKEDWLSVGGYDINMREGLEDWEFWISLLKDGAKVHQLERVEFYYRIKNNSMILSISKVDKMKLKQYIMVKHSEFYIQSINKLYIKYRYLKKRSNRNISLFERLWNISFLNK